MTGSALRAAFLTGVFSDPERVVRVTFAVLERGAAVFVLRPLRVFGGVFFEMVDIRIKREEKLQAGAQSS
jgi:hypothetical protein